MRLQVTCDDIPLAGTVENLLKKHLQDDLQKYVSFFEKDGEDLVATVRVTKATRFGYKITFDLHLPGAHIFSEEKNEDFEPCVTNLRDEVKRQIRKTKEKSLERE